MSGHRHVRGASNHQVSDRTEATTVDKDELETLTDRDAASKRLCALISTGIMATGDAAGPDGLVLTMLE